MRKLLYLFLALPFLFASCVDEDETLGMDLIDQNDKLCAGVFDAVGMQAKFFREDSLVTAKYRYNTLGEYTDSKFGTVKSSIYTSIILSMSSANFAGYESIDSVVVSLAYASGFSEDTLGAKKTMRFEMFEVTEPMDTTKKYSFDTQPTNPAAVFTKDVNVDFNSDVIVGSDTLAPQLRVKIEGEWFNKIKNFTGTASDFDNQFHGLKFALSKTDACGAMAYIDMTSSQSCITVYYTDAGRHQQYYIKFPTSGYRLMHYDYDYSASALSGFASQDTLSGNDLIYLGSMGITMAKINIEDFRDAWKSEVLGGKPNEAAAINSAVLELPVADESMSNNPNVTPRILCYRRYVSGGDTTLVLIHDAQVSETYYGGEYNPKTNSYRMRISMHLANYLNGNITDPDIFLIPDSRRSSAARVILNGPKNTARPATIKITYSKNI